MPLVLIRTGLTVVRTHLVKTRLERTDRTVALAVMTRALPYDKFCKLFRILDRHCLDLAGFVVSQCLRRLT